MKTIALLEKFCNKCQEYCDTPTKTPKEGYERCLTCHTRLNYKKALYMRMEIKKPFKKSKVKKAFEQSIKDIQILYMNCDVTETDRDHFIQTLHFRMKELGL